MDRFFRFFEKFAQPFERGRPGSSSRWGDWPSLPIMRGRCVVGFTAMLLLGGATALIEATLFVLVGAIVDMMNSSTPQTLWQDNSATLLMFALLVGVVRSLIATGTAVVEEQIIVPDFFTLVRWQSHQAVAQQDVSFFDDQLAGRVASKVWQAGQAAGDFMVSLFQIIWFIAIFALTTLIVIANLDWRMLVPVVIWLVAVGLMARNFVPRIRDEGRRLAEAATVVTGRMVDGYSNIRTVKLYGAEASHDQFIQEALCGCAGQIASIYPYHRQHAYRVSDLFQLYAGGDVVRLPFGCTRRPCSPQGKWRLFLPYAFDSIFCWADCSDLLNGLFRNFGTVQNSAELIAKFPQVKDRENAGEMPAASGRIQFEDINFAYAGTNIVLKDLNLNIPAGAESRHCRAVRRRQDHADEPAVTILRSRQRHYSHRRYRYCQCDPARVARPDGCRHPGHIADASVNP